MLYKNLFNIIPRNMILIMPVSLVAACTPFEVVRTLGPDAAYTAAEERSLDDVWDDNKLKLALNQALLDDSVDLFDGVGTVVYEGRVLLVGNVAHISERKRAEQIARAQAGVRSVVNRIHVGDGGGVLAYGKDVLIEKDIQIRLLLDQQVASANLRVRSVDRKIYLFGAARDRREVNRTLTVVRATEDIRGVENLIWIRPGQ